MNLADAFVTVIEKYNLKVGVGQLLVLAADDKRGGNEASEYESSVSINKSEGQFMYALLRFLRPEVGWEVGSGDGSSSVHFLDAMNKNGIGELISIDKEKMPSVVPTTLRARWKFFQQTWPYIVRPENIDFVFEDGDHSEAMTKGVLEQAFMYPDKPYPKLIVVHDYYLHWGVRKACRDFFWKHKYFGEEVGILMDGTNTGIGVWINTKRLD